MNADARAVVHKQALAECLAHCQAPAAVLDTLIGTCRSFIAAGIPHDLADNDGGVFTAFLDHSFSVREWMRRPDGSETGLRDLFVTYAKAGYFPLNEPFFKDESNPHGKCRTALNATIVLRCPTTMEALVSAGVDEMSTQYHKQSDSDRALVPMSLEAVMNSLQGWRPHRDKTLARLKEARMRNRLERDMMGTSHATAQSRRAGVRL